MAFYGFYFSAVFNTINRNILLYRLKVLAGIAGSALDLDISIFLSKYLF